MLLAKRLLNELIRKNKEKKEIKEKKKRGASLKLPEYTFKTIGVPDSRNLIFHHRVTYN